MNPLTLEWAQKAEADHAAATWLFQAPAGFHVDAICFHAQQCIEKYLKAWLQEAGIAFRKSHDLEEFLNLILPVKSVWSTWRKDFIVLTAHAVDFRYPGKSAKPSDSQHALKVCEEVRRAIRTDLGLPV